MVCLHGLTDIVPAGAGIAPCNIGMIHQQIFLKGQCFYPIFRKKGIQHIRLHKQHMVKFRRCFVPVGICL